jgi:sec-independent protein translocase protein TatB
MFDLDAGKMMVFGIVALAVIPPKDLPRVLRTVGKYVGQMRRMAGDFQGQFMQAMKEADLDSVRKEIADINKSANIDTTFDPAALMRDSVTKAVEDKPQEIVHETVAAEAPSPEPIAEPPLAETIAPAPSYAPAHLQEAHLEAHLPEKSAVGPT